MIKKTFFLIPVLMTLWGQALNGQEVADREFTSEEWSGIMKRWISSQPVIIAYVSGVQYYGQPIHAAIDTLYLYPATGFPVGPEWYSRVHAIAFSDISKVLLQKGGKALTSSRQSVSLKVPETDRFFTKPFQDIRTASVYIDSLVKPMNMVGAFHHSKVLRQTFPDKHLRISFSAGIGGDRITASAEEALQQSPLPDPEYAYGQYWTLDVLDISWRFFDRLIVGGKLSSRSTNSSLDAYLSSPDSYGSYYYQIHFAEHVLYAEYAFKNMDRYFTRKSEFLAGAGLLLGRPELALDTWVDYMLDSINYEQDQANLIQDDLLYGVQLRTSFHYYLSPMISLWTGLEVDLYKSWTVKAMEVPSFNPPADPIQLQEHEINLFCIRLKFGVSIYL